MSLTPIRMENLKNLKSGLDGKLATSHRFDEKSSRWDEFRG